MIKMIGFGLAIAVLFDAFVVRMAIVPAVLALLGDKAWWLPSGWTGCCPTSTSRARRSPAAADDTEPAPARTTADPAELEVTRT